MTLDNRIEILECPNKGIVFKVLGMRISKDSTTTSKKVEFYGHVYSKTSRQISSKNVLDNGQFECYTKTE